MKINEYYIPMHVIRQIERHFPPEKIQAKLCELPYLTLVELTAKSIKIDFFIYNHHLDINRKSLLQKVNT